MNEGVLCLLLPLSESERPDRDRIYMSAAMARRLGFRHGDETVLRTPRRRILLTIDVSRPDLPFDKDLVRFRSQHPPPDGTGSEPHPAYVPRQLLRRLRLPEGWPLHLRRNAEGDVRIGPIVGIFCQRYPGRAIFGPQTRFFRRLIEMGRRMGMFVYVFETGDVDRRREFVNAFTWVHRQGWVRTRCPLPHVFYDRGMVTNSVMRIHQWLRLRGVRQFNGYVGSKLWVYRLLADDPELARYIPPTRVLRNGSDLVRMAQQHESVFVKSAGGGKGIGIWVIRRHPGRGYSYRFTDARTRIHQGTTRDVGFIAQRLLNAPRQPWFIQPHLDLPRWRERIFDVRILVQRDGEGRFRVTGTGARIGRKGSFISNIHGGGEARALPPLLQECLGLDEAEAVAMQSKIEGIALSITRKIDGVIRRTGTVGELGIDIAVDRQGNLWFLEANSRTGRNVFAMAGMKDRAHLSMIRPLQYAKLVAGFAN